MHASMPLCNSRAVSIGSARTEEDADARSTDSSVPPDADAWSPTGGLGLQIRAAPRPLATESSPPPFVHEGDSGPKSSASTRRSIPMVPPLILPPKAELECRKYSENSPGSGSFDMDRQFSAFSSFSKPALSPSGFFEPARSSGPPHNTPVSTGQSSMRPVHGAIWELQLQELDGRLHRLFHSHSDSTSRLSALTEQVSLLSESLSACPARIDNMDTRITELALFCQNFADGSHAAVARAGICDDHVRGLLHGLCEQCLADVHRRLDASDSRSEEFLHDLSDLRTMLNTSIIQAAKEQSRLDSLLLQIDTLREAEDSSRASKEAYPCQLGFDTKEPCTLALKNTDTPGVVNLNMLQHCVETVAEVDLIAREARELGEQLCEELRVQKEAFQTHSTITRDKFLFLDELSSRLESFGAKFASESHLREAAMVRIEEQCQQATQKITAAFAADNDRSPSRLLTSNNLSPARTSTSGLLAPSPGVVRTSSAPVRERPVVATSMPALLPSTCVQGVHSLSEVPHWPSTSPSPVARPLGLQGSARLSSPTRSALLSSPTRHVMLSTTSAARGSLSPTRGYVQPAGQVLKASLASTPRAQAVPIVTSKLTSLTTTPRGAASTVCNVCGNMCMDNTSMCRRCTLNSQRIGGRECPC